MAKPFHLRGPSTLTRNRTIRARIVKWERWQAAADEAGVSLNKWVTDMLDEALEYTEYERAEKEQEKQINSLKPRRD